MKTRDEWRNFNEGEWCYEINVSDFIKKIINLIQEEKNF